MYGVNAKGRSIYKGPKGGLYVIEKGKKLYKFPKAATPEPVLRVSPDLEVNAKGRKIFKGAKGGLYVIEKGKKLYKFSKIIPGTRVPKKPERIVSPGKKPVLTPRKKFEFKNRFLKLAMNVKKRKTFPNTKGFTRKPLKFTIKRFQTVDPTKKRRIVNKTVSVKVPVDGSQLSDWIKNGTVLGVSEDTLPMQSWFDAQGKYLQSLNDYDLYTAMSYTVRSHEWIGPYMSRKHEYSMFGFSLPSGHTTPLYSQIMKMCEMDEYKNTHWAKKLIAKKGDYMTYRDMLNNIPYKDVYAAMDMYVQDLKRIVKNAPPLPRTMYVYRGLGRNMFQGKLGAVHVLDQFASTAYVPQRAYASDNYLRIKLLKGTRVLLLQCLNQWGSSNNGEFEVLVNKDSHYIIRKRYLKRYAYNVPNVSKWYPRIHRVTDITVFN